jgi:MFS family permease
MSGGFVLSPAARAEWRGGWPLPFVSAVGYGVSVAHIYSAGLFIAPIEQEFGWSRTAITAGLTVVSVFSVVLAPFFGAMIDRWGARRIGLPGTMLYCAAIAALSLTGGSVWSWWGLWILIALGSLTVKSTIWTSAVASRFDASRGLAMAIALCGAGLGSALLPILTSRLLAEFDWRTAYLALGGILALVAVPLLLPFFRDARDVARRAPGAPVAAALAGVSYREALRGRRFAMIAIVATLSVAAMTSLMVNMVPILRSLSFGTAEAAAYAGLLGIGSIIGRLGTGFLLDRFNGALIGTIAFALPVLGVGLLSAASGTPPLAMAGCFILGLALGTEVDVIGFITSRYFGMRAFGAIFGTIVGLQSLSTGLGPMAGSAIYDLRGSYTWLLIGVVPIFIVCALLVSRLGSYPDLDTQSAGTTAATPDPLNN